MRLVKKGRFYVAKWNKADKRFFKDIDDFVLQRGKYKKWKVGSKK